MPWQEFEDWVYFYRVSRWNENPNEVDDERRQAFFEAYKREMRALADG